MITVVDDDSGLVATDVKAPAPLPPREARLTVNLKPLESDGRWRFVGERHWRASGSVADGLLDGKYEIEFKPVKNFAHPLPTNAPVLNGVNQSLDVYYIPTSSLKQGSPQVMCEGTALGGWKFEEETDAAYRPSGTILSNLNTGTYAIQFRPVDGFIPPGIMNAEVRPSVPLTYSGKYLPAPAVSSDRIRPVVTPFGLWKYPFIGEISRGDGELGSGFVVRERVVLTAAHVVFDQRTLSNAKRVRWHFQKHRGAYEPQPQIPRGWCLYEGYAAQRQTEGANSASTVFSQNLDAAALFFAEPAARGGFGGYLASTNALNEWLVGASEKILSGYPINGIPKADQEKIHEATPVPVSFTRVLQLASGTLYRTSQLLSYPGNSGGPLCVRHSNGNFYPAGIFVSVDADNIYVKGLDQKVLEIMNAAELSGITGTNATSGGVINFGTSLTDFGDETGYLQVSLAPDAAVNAGAGWRFAQGNPAYVAGANTGARVLAFDFQIEFKPIAGFVPPTNVLVQIAPNTTNSVSIRYRRLQEITFSAVTNLVLGGGPVTLTATASSQLPVRFEVILGPARLSASSLTATGAGRVTVRAVQDGNDDFAAASVERSFEVIPGSDNTPRLVYSSQAGLILTGKIGTTYRVQVTEALSDRPNWTVLTTVTLTTSPMAIPNTQPFSQGARFYRALVAP